MTKANDNSSSWCALQRKNTIQLAIWTFAWLLSMALLAFGARYLWNFETMLSIFALILNLILGGVMIRANIIYINGLDEMQRKVTFDTFGITLGVGLIAGLAYETLEDIKLISYEPEIGHLIMLMGITYMIATILGHRRYR